MQQPMYKFSRRTAAIAFLIFSLTALAGCATLDEDECRNADWFSIGLEDGARGYPASHISQHRKACAKYGIAPDFATYEQGRQKGLEEYCTPRNGYARGNAGKRYNGSCPKHLEAAYIRALNQGRDVYNYAGSVKKQEQELQKQHDILEAIEKDIADTEEELVRPGVSPQRRRQLLDELRHLEEDQKSMLTDIADMEHTLEGMEERLARMRARNPYP